jgi:hypothetical protein
MARVRDRQASQANLNRGGDRALPVITRIVCGGQSGADRAAVDFAVSNGVPYGGWVPRDGWAEDFPDPPGVLGHYQYFVATNSSDPHVRTGLNVRDSNATLIVARGEMNSPGVAATRRAAHFFARPLLQIDTSVGRATEQLRPFLTGLETPLTLNVAGPRESECPGIYDATISLLTENLNLFHDAPTDLAR